MEKSVTSATILYFYVDEKRNKVPVLVSSGTKSSVYSNLVDKEEIKRIAHGLPESHQGLYALVDGEVFKLQISNRNEKMHEENRQTESNETEKIFEGISFKHPPVSEEEYIKVYEEYVKRCSS